MAEINREIEGGRYAAGAILLHWVIAALIVLQVVLAGRMEGRTPEAFAVIQLHKSIGITVLLLSLARLGWRLVNPPPPEPAALAAWERKLSTVVHWAFYVVMIGMPLTGWIMVSASRIEIPTLLFGVAPWPHLPGLPDLVPGAKAAWHEAGELGHGVIIKGFYVLIALHVAGALKHQFLRDDEPILARMAPGAVAGRWLEPRVLVIALGVVAVIVAGRLIQPPRVHTAASTAPQAEAPPPDPAAPAKAPEPVAPAEVQAVLPPTRLGRRSGRLSAVPPWPSRQPGAGTRSRAALIAGPRRSCSARTPWTTRRSRCPSTWLR